MSPVRWWFEYAPARAGRQGVSSPVPSGIAAGDAKRRALLAVSRAAGLKGCAQTPPHGSSSHQPRYVRSIRVAAFRVDR
jgi:hypothetical protein